MPTPAYNLAFKAFGRAIGDALLRTLCIIAILSFGYWVPSLYLDEKYGILGLFGPGLLADATFSFAKASAFVYGAFTLWNLLHSLATYSTACAEAAMAERLSRRHNGTEMRLP